MQGAPLVGREHELQLLDERLELMLAGNAQFVIVTGEAGEGKSRLVSEFSSRAGKHAQVAVGRSIELLDSSSPLAPVVALLRQLLRGMDRDLVEHAVGNAHIEISRLVPDIVGNTAHSTPEAGADRLFDAVVGLLDRVALIRPLVLIFEDIQWADATTLDLLVYIARALREAATMTVVTVRTPSAVALPSRLARRFGELATLPHVRTLELGPLGTVDVTRLAESIAGTALPTSIARDIAERSGGNAFFAEELARASGGETSDVPRTVQSFLDARVADLDPQARRVLDATAIGGASVGHDLLAQIADMEDERLASGIEDLLQAGLLVADPNEPRYAFRHALIREAVLRKALPATRRTLYRRAAEALQDDPSLLAGERRFVDALLVVHWEGAGDIPKTIEAAVRAARSAGAMWAYADAVDLYARAIALWTSGNAQSPMLGLAGGELLIEAADTARLNGDTGRAIEWLNEAISSQELNREQAAEAFALLGWACILAGDASGDAHLERGLELLVDQRPGPALSRLLAWRARFACTRDHTVAAVADARAALAVGQEFDLPDASISARITIASCPDDAGLSLGEARALLAEARGEARGLGMIEQVIRAFNNEAAILRDAGRNREAYAVEEELMRDLQRPVSSFERDGTRIRLALIAIEIGKIDEASRSLDAAEHGPASATAIFAGVRARLALVCDELEVAREWMTAAFRIDAAEQLSQEERQWFVGSLARATDDLDLVQLLPNSGLTRTINTYAEWWVETLRCASTKALRASEHNRDSDLLAANAIVTELLADENLPHLDAYRLAGAAERDRAFGTPDPNQFGIAAKAFDALDAVLNAAECRVGEVECALALDDRARAQRVVDLAYGPLADVGARLYTRRLRVLAKAARLKLPKQPLKREVGPLAEFRLTPRETDVLALLAEGLTNKQIAARLKIGTRTVESHVQFVLNKLHVSHRGEAAKIARVVGLDWQNRMSGEF